MKNVQENVQINLPKKYLQQQNVIIYMKNFKAMFCNIRKMFIKEIKINHKRMCFSKLSQISSRVNSSKPVNHWQTYITISN